MIVHVVTWSPSVLSSGGSGGFEWRYDPQDALTVLLRAVNWFGLDQYTNAGLVHIDVPVDETLDVEARGEAITAWIDSNLHLLEPGLP